MIASDVPYVLGGVVLFAAACWLIGRAADRGAFTGRKPHLVFRLIFVAWLAASAVAAAIEHNWWWAGIGAVGAIALLWEAVRDWRAEAG